MAYHEQRVRLKRTEKVCDLETLDWVAKSTGEDPAPSTDSDRSLAAQ